MPVCVSARVCLKTCRISTADTCLDFLILVFVWPKNSVLTTTHFYYSNYSIPKLFIASSLLLWGKPHNMLYKVTLNAIITSNARTSSSVFLDLNHCLSDVLILRPTNYDLFSASNVFRHYWSIPWRPDPYVVSLWSVTSISYLCFCYDFLQH